MKPRIAVFNPSRIFTIFVASIMTIVLTGCGATRFNQKAASLNEGDPCSELRYESHIKNFIMYIPKVYVYMDSGEAREDLIVDKDSACKTVSKLAFSFTPLGMVCNAIDTAGEAIYVPPGRIDLLIVIQGTRKLSDSKAGSDKTGDRNLISVWNYKVPVDFEPNERYTAVYDQGLLIKDDKGSIVTQVSPETILEDKEFNENAYVLSEANKEIVDRGKKIANAMGIKPIPIYTEKNGNLVVISGAIDISKITIEKEKWILDNAMIINAGKRPFSINDVTVNHGEYLISRSGKYIKESLMESGL